jgi:hypothetical protein
MRAILTRRGVRCGGYAFEASSGARRLSKSLVKIPVLGTVSRAYGFLLGEVATILRLTWAPLLFGAYLWYLFGEQILTALIASLSDPSRPFEEAAALFLVSLASYLTSLMAMVALLGVMIFGDRKPGLFVYALPGRAEFRLLLVSLLLIVALIAVIVGALLVFGFVGALARAFPVFSIVLLLALGALLFAAVWVPLRLSLIAPVVVAEHSLGVERSWALTSGNAARMLLIVLLTFVPYSLVSGIALSAILGSDNPTVPVLPTFSDPEVAKSEVAMKEALDAFWSAWTQYQIDNAKALRAHLLEITLLSFIGNVVTTALLAGVTGSAYSTLAGVRHE